MNDCPDAVMQRGSYFTENKAYFNKKERKG